MMNPEDILLSEISQTQDKYYMIPLMRNLEYSNKCKQSIEWWFLGGEENKEVIS